MPRTLKRPVGESIIVVLAISIALITCVSVLYQFIDAVGAMVGLWIGNPLSLTLANMLDTICDAVGTALIRLVLQASQIATAWVTLLGYSKFVAQTIVFATGALIYCAGVVGLISLIRPWRRKFWTIR